MYDFSILKVMTVCINVYAGLCDIFSFSITDLSQADFVKSTAYLIITGILALTHKLSHIPIPGN